MTQQSQQNFEGNKSVFRQIEEALSGELVDSLCREHDREVQELYEEQLQLRQELSQTVTLMQNEILPREKQMHDLIEKLHEAHELATTNLHARLTEHMQSSRLAADQRSQREQMLDPLQAMEQELGRIAELLSHNIVQPDIQGWAPRQDMRSPQASAAGPRSAATTSPTTATRGRLNTPLTQAAADTKGAFRGTARTGLDSKMQSPVGSAAVTVSPQAASPVNTGFRGAMSPQQTGTKTPTGSASISPSSRPNASLSPPAQTYSFERSGPDPKLQNPLSAMTAVSKAAMSFKGGLSPAQTGARTPPGSSSPQPGIRPLAGQIV